MGFSETLNGEMPVVLTCCDLTSGCPERVAYAKGKRHSKDIGKGLMDTVLRNFIPQAVKKLADSSELIVQFFIVEILSHAKICRCYNWVAGLGNNGISLSSVWFSSPSILREASLNKH